MADMPMEQEVSPEAEQQGGSAGSPTELLVATAGNLTKIAAMFAKAPGIPDEQKQAMAQIDASFKDLITSLTSQGSGGSPAAGKSQAVPMRGATTMEAGASGRAVPAM